MRLGFSMFADIARLTNACIIVLLLQAIIALVAYGVSLSNAAHASQSSYDGLQGAGNRDCCALATQGVSKWNPCWPGWRLTGR